MENYEVIGLIGKGKNLGKILGNFGSISKIRRKTDNKILVWKELDYGKMSEKEKQHIVAEVNILRDLKHPNIVRYFDRIIDKKNTKIYIITEFCEGGDIGALIKRCKKNKDYIAEDVIWKIFTQIVLALHECHTRKEGKILHRDLKPSNVFLDSENNVKLGDFGLSRVLSNESVFAYSHVGTPYYMSPEQIDEKEYNERSDIWSLGCFLFELATFNPPFEATNHLSLALKIKNGKVERIPSRFSEELNRVIAWMLSIDQSKRPSIEDLLNLPHVSLRLRERRLKDNMAKLKKIEDTLKNREIELNDREKDLEKREGLLLQKEDKVKELERKLIEIDSNIPKNKYTDDDRNGYHYNNYNMLKKTNSSIEQPHQFLNVNLNLQMPKMDDHEIFSERIKTTSDNLVNMYKYNPEVYNLPDHYDSSNHAKSFKNLNESNKNSKPIITKSATQININQQRLSIDHSSLNNTQKPKDDSSQNFRFDPSLYQDLNNMYIPKTSYLKSDSEEEYKSYINGALQGSNSYKDIGYLPQTKLSMAYEPVSLSSPLNHKMGSFTPKNSTKLKQQNFVINKENTNSPSSTMVKSLKLDPKRSNKIPKTNGY